MGASGLSEFFSDKSDGLTTENSQWKNILTDGRHRNLHIFVGAIFIVLTLQLMIPTSGLIAPRSVGSGLNFNVDSPLADQSIHSLIFRLLAD